MELYSRGEISEQKEMRKRVRAAMIILSAAAVLFCVVLLFCVHPLSEKRFRVYAIAAAALAGCFDIYAGSFVLPYARPKPRERTVPGKIGRTLLNILRQTHMYVIWVILSAVFVSFLFNLVTDAAPAKKIVIYAQTETVKSAELETVLNADLPEGIKLTKVHPFSYSAFGLDGEGDSDIYIVKESSIQDYISGFVPLEVQFDDTEGYELYYFNGEPYGIRIFDSVNNTGSAAFCLEYLPGSLGGPVYEGQNAEDYYLFFGKNSLHLGKDGASAYIALKLLQTE